MVIELRAGDGRLDGRLDADNMVLEVRRGDQLHRYYLAAAQSGRIVVEQYRVLAGGNRLLDRVEKVVGACG